jgi:hypothetical protein
LSLPTHCVGARGFLAQAVQPSRRLPLRVLARRFGSCGLLAPSFLSGCFLQGLRLAQSVLACGFGSRCGVETCLFKSSRFQSRRFLLQGLLLGGLGTRGFLAQDSLALRLRARLLLPERLGTPGFQRCGLAGGGATCSFGAGLRRRFARRDLARHFGRRFGSPFGNARLLAASCFGAAKLVGK